GRGRIALHADGKKALLCARGGSHVHHHDSVLALLKDDGCVSLQVALLPVPGVDDPDLAIGRLAVYEHVYVLTVAEREKLAPEVGNRVIRNVRVREAERAV